LQVYLKLILRIIRSPSPNIGLRGICCELSGDFGLAEIVSNGNEAARVVSRIIKIIKAKKLSDTCKYKKYNNQVLAGQG